MHPHVVLELQCPACQCSLSLQVALQQQQQQQIAQERQQRRTIMESMKILEQGQEAERLCELGKAFRLYKTGCAGAIQGLKLSEASGLPIVMIEACRKRAAWAMRRSEQILRALKSLEQPPPQVAQQSLQQPLLEQPLQQPRQVAQQQPLQFAQPKAHPQTQWQPPPPQRAQIVVRDLVSATWQQQQQLLLQQEQQQEQRARPRQPSSPPPHELLKQATPKAMAIKSNRAKPKFEGGLAKKKLKLTEEPVDHHWSLPA